MNTAAGICIPIPRETRAVKLRCGLTAIVWRLGEDEKWAQLGIDREGFVHAWLGNGRWSDEETQHLFDIVANLVPSK